MPEKSSVATIRLLAQAWWLKQFGPVSMERFAKHFHRSKRQASRDVNTIGEVRDSMPGESFELDWDQLEGGIVCIHGMSDLIQKPALTTHEALQILLGLRVMIPFLDQAGREQATSLILTLAPLVQGFDALKLIFVDTHDAAPAVVVAKQAIEHRRQLRFTYQDRHGRTTSRLVDPQRLEHRMDGWYLSAWCYLARGPRTFRASAMSEVAVGERDVQEHAPLQPEFIEILQMTTTNDALWLVDDHIAELVSTKGGVLTLKLVVWDHQWVLGLLIELGDSIIQLPQVWADLRRDRAREICDVWNQVERV